MKRSGIAVEFVLIVFIIGVVFYWLHQPIEIKKGQITQSSDYDDVGYCDSYNQMVVRKGTKYGVVRNGGVVIIPPMYDWISSRPKNGLRVMEKDGKYGIVDVSGDEVLYPEYDDIYIADEIIELRQGMIYFCVKIDQILTVI